MGKPMSRKAGLEIAMPGSDRAQANHPLRKFMSSGKKHEPRYEAELESLMIKTAKDKRLFHEFLVDLLSPAEYRELALRWQIVKRLKNKIPHRLIAADLKTSVATVTRGSRELINNQGGFNQVYKKYYKKTSG